MEPSSAPTPAQGAPDGSGQLSAPRTDAGPLSCPSQPRRPPLTVQAPPSARRVRWRRSLARCWLGLGLGLGLANPNLTLTLTLTFLTLTLTRWSSARRRAGCSSPCRGGHRCACVTVARASIAAETQQTECDTFFTQNVSGHVPCLVCAETTHGTSKINARAARSARDHSVRTVEPRVSPPRHERPTTNSAHCAYFNHRN